MSTHGKQGELVELLMEHRTALYSYVYVCIYVRRLADEDSRTELGTRIRSGHWPTCGTHRTCSASGSGSHANAGAVLSVLARRAAVPPVSGVAGRSPDSTCLGRGWMETPPRRRGPIQT